MILPTVFPDDRIFRPHALARVWREGQKRQVHLIRLITADGLEERILQRQIAKSLLVTTAISSLASGTSGSLSLGELKVRCPPLFYKCRAGRGKKNCVACTV
ncbi:unnamed protein product [Hydatigera taeniaeformis]|uniref:FhuF_C domain-containing protein n=1 Tax=Hydatigena taeniaeformis TaxID=6205 RepID=A0A0R3WW52_HYDTA|nr:unnamed protein product [Hydatigera taeniaeformis]